MYAYRRYGKVKPLQKTKKSLDGEKWGKRTKRTKKYHQSRFLEAPLVRKADGELKKETNEKS